MVGHSFIWPMRDEELRHWVVTKKLSFRETASKMGLNPTTVSNRAHKLKLPSYRQERSAEPVKPAAHLEYPRGGPWGAILPGVSTLPPLPSLQGSK